MNISKVSSVNFGNIRLSDVLKKSIEKNRPADAIKDAEYIEKIKKLQAKLNTGNEGNYTLDVRGKIEEGYYDDGNRWTDGGYGWQEEPQTIPDSTTVNLYLDNKDLGVLYQESTKSKKLLKGDFPAIVDKLLEFMEKTNIKKIEKKLHREILNKQKKQILAEKQAKSKEQMKKRNDEFFKTFLA